MKQILSISNIILFVVALALTIGAAEIVNACGGDKLSSTLTGVAAGIVGTMIIGGIAEKCDWSIASSPVAGAIGALVGTAVYYFFL